MFRNSAKAVGAFILGGSATLLFERAVEGMPIVFLVAAIVLGIFLLVFGYGPEVRHWWWLKKQIRMTFDLTVVELTGVYSFLARHQEMERTLFSVTWDMKHKNKFAVSPGERVRVTGKMQQHMTDGLNVLVECNVLVLSSEGGASGMSDTK